MKSLIIALATSGGVLLASCSKEQLPTAQVNQSKSTSAESANLGIKRTKLEQSLLFTESYSIDEAISKAEERLNRQFDQIPPVIPGTKMTNYTLQLPLVNGRIANQDLVNWILAQSTKVVNQLIGEVGSKVLAIDVVERNYRVLQNEIVEINTIVYSYSNQLIKIDCSFKQPMNEVVAATALETRYNNCPLRYIGVGEYFKEVYSMAYNPLQGFQNYYYQQDFLWTTYNAFNVPTRTSAQAWNEYADKLAAMIEIERPIFNNAKDNFVFVTYFPYAGYKSHSLNVMYTNRASLLDATE